MIDLQDGEHDYLCGNDENSLFTAIYIKTEPNTSAHHKVLDDGLAKFEVINVHNHYFQQYDKDIPCAGGYIAWDIQNVKKKEKKIISFIDPNTLPYNPTTRTY